MSGEKLESLKRGHGFGVMRGLVVLFGVVVVMVFFFYSEGVGINGEFEFEWTCTLYQ